MDGSLSAGLFQFLLRGIRLRDSQVVGDGIVEQLGILSNERFHITEIVRIDLADRNSGNGDGAILDIPEPH